MGSPREKSLHAGGPSANAAGARGGDRDGLSFPTEAERVVVALNLCRDHAAGITALALEAATAPDGSGRTETMRALAAVVDAYRAELDGALTPAMLGTHQPRCAADISAIRGLLDRLDGLAVARGSPARDEAVHLSRQVRETVLPAIRNLTNEILVKAAEDQNTVLRAVHARNKELEHMFGDMDRIGRTIRLIAVNAAVEAARTGGESGRAFGVIATEVRALSTQAADLLSRARSNLEGRGHS